MKRGPHFRLTHTQKQWLKTVYAHGITDTDMVKQLAGMGVTYCLDYRTRLRQELGIKLIRRKYGSGKCT